MLTLNNGANIFSVMYRPPKGNSSDFLTFLDTYLNWINENNHTVTLGGYLNIDFLQHSTVGAELTRIIEANSCINAIQLPTRVTATTETLIDVFITNVESGNHSAGVIDYHISDHLPIFLVLDNLKLTNHLKKPAQPVTTRDINPTTLDRFHTELMKVDWADVFQTLNPEEA